MIYTLSLSKVKNDAAGLVHWLILFGVSGGTLLALASGLFVPDWFGEGRYLTHPIPYGEQMPAMDKTPPKLPEEAASTPEGQAVLRRWSEMNLPRWKTHGKGSAPRILLAKLAENTDVEAANRYICSLTPWSGAGSTWTFHRGDYDFTLVTLTTLLYMFGHQPDRMYPETQQYLLDVLLNQEGGVPLVTAPRSGLILDTENHHLMTEGSRYLKNQWLAANGTGAQRADPRYNNRENGLEGWLIGNLEEMLREGVYEFNSRPYLAYTIQALLNLEAYPESQQIRMRARHLLNIINLQYALGSLDLRRYPPFRRQYKKAGETGMNNDAHTAYIRIWTGGTRSDAGERSDFALLAGSLPYRLPEDLCTWTLSKPTPYFVRYGRGACPHVRNLYSGGPGYLLSAGGANRGWRSRIVARPVTLMLSDGATDVEECFRIPGQGHWRRWNSTGVYRRFAVANAPVIIPKDQKAVVEGSGWQLFKGSEISSLLIATYSGSQTGIIALFPEAEEPPETLLALLQQKNPDAEALHQRFIWPDGIVLEYDPDAPKGMWVMKSENGVALDRNYDAWPQLDGDVPVLSFERQVSGID